MKRIGFPLVLCGLLSFSFGQSIPSITASFDYVESIGGDYIEITIRPNISSNTSFSNDIYCDISFPQNFVSSIRQVSINDWDSFGQYDEGEVIYHRNQYSFPANYTLVSLVRNGWDSNTNLEAIFRVYINQSLEEYKIFYRSTIADTDTWLGHKIEPEDDQGDEYDQQGWPVYEFVITSSLSDLDIAGTPDIVDENSSAISNFYIGDRIKVVADVDNDGEAYSETTDLRFYYNSSASPWDLITVDPVAPDGKNVQYISDLITLDQVGTNYVEVFVNEQRGFDEVSFNNNDKLISFEVSAVPRVSLQVNVFNVGGATNFPGDNGRVELYNSDHVYTGEDRTNASGQAEFSEIEPAKGYRVEVFHDPGNTIHGEEYWGKKTGIDVLDGDQTLVEFDRFMPYIESVDFFNNETGEQLNGNEITQGTEVRAEAVVRNNGGAFKVRTKLYVDRDESSTYDHEFTSGVQSIASGGTATYVFEFVPDNLGQHWYSVATETDYPPLGGYTITDGWDWSESHLFNMKSAGGTISLEITVLDENMQIAPNIEVLLIFEQAIVETKLTDNQGAVHFEDLNSGSYKIMVNKLKETGDRELWAIENVSLESHQSISISRNTPYVSDFGFIYKGKDLEQPIKVGETLVVYLSVENLRNGESNFNTEIRLDRLNGDSETYDIVELKENLIITGGSGIDIPFEVSFSQPGEYQFSYEISTNVDGEYYLTDILEFTIDSQIKVDGLERILWLGKEPEDEVFEGDNVLLLVHGWQANGTPADPGQDIWDNLVRYAFDKQDFKETFEIYRLYYYSNYVSIDSLGKLLRDTLDFRALNDPKFRIKEITLVGHSMGGLVSRAFMNTISDQPPFENQEGGDRVKKLITLGTPHHGSPMANGAIRNTLLTSPNIGLLATFDALLFSKYRILSFRVNRHDLKWDNFDDLYRSYRPWFLNEKNDWLNELNENRNHDQKIITYFGSFNNRENKRDNQYRAYQAGNLAMFEMGLRRFLNPIQNDGIVPTSSAIFEGHDVKLPIRFFPGYDHSEIGYGSADSQGLDEVLFGSIINDLVESETHSIASIPADQINFGRSLVKQSKDSSINIINNGSETINIETIILAGGDSDQFQIKEADESPLNPGETRSIGISFLPTSTDTKSTFLSVVNDSENLPNMSIRLSGNGSKSDTGALEILSGNNTDLGNVLISSMKNEVIQFASVGSRAVSILGMDIIGQDAESFIITYPSETSFVIDANKNHDVIITFNANSIGSKTATLKIETDLENDPTLFVHFYAVVTDNFNVAPVIYDGRFSVSEHAPSGKSIGKVSAEDANFDQLAFEIISSSRPDIISIDSESGELIIIDSVLLDFETGRFIELVVQTADEEFTDSATVIIEILNVQEPLSVYSERGYNIYPNPSTGNYILDLGDDFTPQQMTIMDLSGRIIFRHLIFSSKTPIDLSSEPDGLYFIYLGQKDSFIKVLKGTE